MATHSAPMTNGTIAKMQSSILRATVLVGAATIVVKLLGMLKEMAAASVYGRSDEMDAFLVAALVPGLLVNLISESMNQALVPTLIRVRELEGRERAQQVLSSAMLSLCVLLGVTSLAMALAAPLYFPLLAANFSASKLHLAIRLFYALTPIVLITGIATNCTAVLNTTEDFVVPAMAPAVISIAVIVSALGFGATHGIWAMAWGMLAGSLAHMILVIARMRQSGYKLRLRWARYDEATREIAGQYGNVFLSSIVASGGLLVDQSMAAMLSAGSVSALAYANRFVSVTLTLMAGALSTAIVPYLSRLVAHRDWEACRHTLRRWAGRGAAVSVLMTAALIAAARPLVRAALQHGRFGVHDTAVVATVLAMYALQIPFYVVSRVHYRFLIAMRRTDIVLACGVANLILDVVLNLIFMRRYGVAGIALSTSLWMVSTCICFWYYSERLLTRAVAERGA